MRAETWISWLLACRGLSVISAPGENRVTDPLSSLSDFIKQSDSSCHDGSTKFEDHQNNASALTKFPRSQQTTFAKHTDTTSPRQALPPHRPSRESRVPGGRRPGCCSLRPPPPAAPHARPQLPREVTRQRGGALAALSGRGQRGQSVALSPVSSSVRSGSWTPAGRPPPSGHQHPLNVKALSGGVPGTAV